MGISYYLACLETRQYVWVGRLDPQGAVPVTDVEGWIKKIKIVAPLPHDSGAPERTKRNAKLSQPWPSEPKGQVSANKNCRSPLYLRSRAS